MYKVYLENKTDSGGHNYNLFKNMPLYLVSVAKKKKVFAQNAIAKFHINCTVAIYGGFMLTYLKWQSIKTSKSILAVI